jgi:hypothetical protein
MAEIHDQLQAEGVVKETFGTIIKGKRAVPGRLYLTSQRLVFLQANPVLALFGAIGGLLTATVKPKRVGVDIPLAGITGVTRGKFGINKNILEVSRAGAEPVRLAVKYDEWEQALQGATAPAVS